MDAIATKGIKQANSLRMDLNLNMFQPINIYDVCNKLEIDVRFVRINMEGMYISSDNPAKSNIVLSALRPFSRKVFTCAHELGHHLFRHGSKIDMINQQNSQESTYDVNERLVDIFASALLMPIAGVQLEFKKRGWDPGSASPIQYFTISSVFGVGYRTLISNCTINNLISTQKSKELSKYSPSHFLKKIVNQDKRVGHLKIIDNKYKETTVDTEVTGYLYLPKDVDLEGSNLEPIAETTDGVCYKVLKPGVLRANNSKEDQTYFIRIQNFEYEGISEYRHLEN